MRIDNNSTATAYCINKDVYNGEIPAHVKSGNKIGLTLIRLSIAIVFMWIGY